MTDDSKVKMTDLRPDRGLLDPDFMGYKLSLDAVPVYNCKIPEGVDHVLPSEEQFSYLHVKLFSLHNHLYGDPWSEDDIYFVDKLWRIHRNVLNKNTRRLQTTEIVWQLDKATYRKPGDYNVSLSFPSPELIMISNGAGQLYLLHTGPRNEHFPWKILYCGQGIENGPASFSIATSQYKERNSCQEEEVHCILMYIDSTQSKSLDSMPTEGNKPTVFTFDKHGPYYRTILEWITLVPGSSQQWYIKSTRQLQAKGEVDYVALEKSCAALYVASENLFKFVKDSESPIQEEEEKTTVEAEKYVWLQTSDSIKIWVKLPEAVTLDDIKVILKSKHITVLCKDQILLEGSTCKNINEFSNPEKSIQIEPVTSLELVIDKEEAGLRWPDLFCNNCEGKELLDVQSTAPLSAVLEHLVYDQKEKEAPEGTAPAFNPQQLEECDNVSTNTSVLTRIDKNTHSITHKINLSGHQLLFSTYLSPDAAPALCLRHDVDGCVWWLPEATEKEWQCKHVGTFLAFGYVQASKQQRKFSTCPPDMSYVAICETSRRVYLYRQAIPACGTLRNRTTGAIIKQTAKQQMLNVDSNDDIVGVHASNRCLYVLTTCELYSFQIAP